MPKEKQGVFLLLLTFLVAVLLYTAAAYGQVPKAMIAIDQNSNSVTLYTNEECALFPLKGWKRAAVFYNGRRLGACWVVTADMVTMIVDEDGDVSRVPVSAFRPLVES